MYGYTARTQHWFSWSAERRAATGSGKKQSNGGTHWKENFPYGRLKFTSRKGRKGKYSSVCVSTSVTKSFCFSQLLSRRGRDGRFPSHANEAREIDWMEVWTQTSVPARMKTFAHAVTPLVSMVVVRMISLKTGFLSFGKVLVRLLNSSVLRTLAPYRSCSKGLMQ